MLKYEWFPGFSYHKSAAINIFLFFGVKLYMHFCWVELLDCMMYIYLTLTDITNQFSKISCHFTCLLAIGESSHCSMCLSTLRIVSF